MPRIRPFPGTTALAALACVLGPFGIPGCDDSSPTIPRRAPVAPAPAPPPATSSIFGRVTANFADGPMSIRGVAITVSDLDLGREAGSAVTDEGGAYEVSGLTGRRFEVRAEAPGYLAPATLLDVAPGARRELDIVLQHRLPLVVFGRVFDPAGAGVPDALVQAVDLDLGYIVGGARTNSNGSFEIRDLTGDGYRIAAFATGFPDPKPRVIWRSSTRSHLFEIDFVLGGGELEEPPPGPGADFDRTFWNELVFDMHDCPDELACPDYFGVGRGIGPLESRRTFVLHTPSPNFYIRTHDDAGERTIGTRRANEIRREIPDIVAAITGMRYEGDIEIGSADREQIGWITILSVSEEADPDLWDSDDDSTFVCGRARVGWVEGRIWLNSSRISDFRTLNACTLLPLLRHEIGHAMGFHHVGDEDAILFPRETEAVDFSPAERFHAQLAYEVGRHRLYSEGPLQPFPPSPGRFSDGDPAAGPRVVNCPGAVVGR